MQTSAELHEIASALAKAQGAMIAAKKETINPFFKSTYADLASVVEAIKRPFADNGLSYVQGTDCDESDAVVVVTRIMHTSGQWIESRLRMKPIKNDPQGIGSTITYARRYALQSMAGVPSEDDDGNAAANQYAQKNIKGTPVAKPDHKVDVAKLSDWAERKALLEKINAIRDAKKYTDTKMLSFASMVLNRPLMSFNDVSDEDLKTVVARMEAASAAKA